MRSRKRLKTTTNDQSVVSNAMQNEIPYLPREILVTIFEFYAKSEGTVKLLTHISKVNSVWKEAATDSILWRTVNDPELSWSRLLSLKKLLLYTRELDVSHLRKSLTTDNIMSVLPFCPRLRSINFQTCDASSPIVLTKFPKFCPSLHKVTFSSGRLIMLSLSPLLTICGPRLKYLDLSRNVFEEFSTIMRTVAESCPLLEELHLQCIGGVDRSFPFEAFQLHCPKLRVLELDDVEMFSSPNISGPGFPELEIFSCRVIAKPGPDDNTLIGILHSSSKLKALILPGNTNMTYRPLLNLNCTLETLNLSRSKVANLSLHYVIDKWKHSLKSLDLSVINSVNAVSGVIWKLISGNQSCKLTELNLSASPILCFLLKELLMTCQKLTFLNLESCCYLPEVTRRIYRTYDEIQDLRVQLNMISA